MRIAFMGASGTGKTTLAKVVAARFGLEVNPVGSRQVAEAMGFASPYDVDQAGRRAEFQERLLLEKTAWESEHPSFVTDRTTLDNLAYSMLHLGADLRHMIDQAQEASRRYDAIFFCTLTGWFDTGDDPARVRNVEYHRAFEIVLRGLLACHEEVARNVWAVSGIDLANREQFVLNVCDAHRDQR